MILHGDPVAPVILGVTSILAFAVAARVASRRLNQPTVLGELLMGIVLGNLGYYLGFDLITVLREGSVVFEVVNEALAGARIGDVAAATFPPDKASEITRIITGPSGGQVMQVAHSVDIFSRYGIIFMLFMVGLETRLEEMKSVGADSLRVAAIGVALPVALGFAAEWLLRPDLPFSSRIFVAATLAATSVSISATVLKETGRMQSREGRVILGAAVADDVLGLVLLAVISGIAVSGSVDVPDVVEVIITSLVFLVLAVVLGPAIVRMSARIMQRLDVVEAKMFTSYLFVMVLAWTANLAGLATIIGAFAAGVILHDSFFPAYHDSNGKQVVSIRELIMPLEVILVPLFFILMGMQVKAESFLSLPVMYLAAGLLVAAILGKLLSGLGALPPTSRLVVGSGMMPRGEVGLVFAAIGRTLGVIDDSVFAAIVLMVIVTTLLAPPWLEWAIHRAGPAGAGDDEPLPGDPG